MHKKGPSTGGTGPSSVQGQAHRNRGRAAAQGRVALSGAQGTGHRARGHSMGHAQQYGIPTRRTCRCANHYCSHHQVVRAMWLPYVLAGKVQCWRCGNPLDPAEPWDLGHNDDDTTKYEGPECRPCNRSTATRRKERANRWVL